MATITATAGSASANSYLTIAAADAIAETMLSTRGYSADLDSDTKTRALITATRYLDQLEWVGLRASTTQALGWPRTDVVVDGVAYSSTAIPEEVQYATFDIADALLADDTLFQYANPALGTSGELIPGIPNSSLRRAKLDVLEVEFATGVAPNAPAVRNVLTLLPHLVGVLGPLTTSAPRTGNSRTIGIARS